MMRYLIILALLMCLPVRGEAWQVVGGGASSAAYIFYEDFEGAGKPNTFELYTPSTSTVDYDYDPSATGDERLHMGTTSQRTGYLLQAGDDVSSGAYYGFTFSISAIPAATKYVAAVSNSHIYSGGDGDWFVDSSGQLKGGPAGWEVTTLTVTAGVEYECIMHYVPSPDGVADATWRVASRPVGGAWSTAARTGQKTQDVPIRYYFFSSADQNIIINDAFITTDSSVWPQ